MGRRQKSSPAEDLIHLVSLMPWWAGCVLALAAYLLLHPIAVGPAAAPLVQGQLANAITHTVWKTAAMFGQYLIPIICLLGAGVSAYGRSKRNKLVENVSGSRSAAALEGMSWQEFELLVGEAFRLKGYQVTESGGGGPDGGVDLVLRKGGDKFLVQCKQWKAFSVGVTVVRELYGVMASSGAAGGFVVTSGRFTVQAQEFANGRNVSLVDGPALMELIRQAKAAGVGGQRVEKQVAAAATTEARISPSCPVCSKPMVQRTAKRGAGVGNSFWGCSDFPTCRGTRKVEAQ